VARRHPACRRAAHTKDGGITRASVRRLALASITIATQNGLDVEHDLARILPASDAEGDGDSGRRNDWEKARRPRD
jgi:hypothetical protein